MKKVAMNDVKGEPQMYGPLLQLQKNSEGIFRKENRLWIMEESIKTKQ